MILLKLYGATIMFSMIVTTYFKYLIENNSNFKDKMINILGAKLYEDRKMSNPFLFVFIPLINLMVSGMIIFIISADEKSIKDFLKK